MARTALAARRGPGVPESRKPRALTLVPGLPSDLSADVSADLSAAHDALDESSPSIRPHLSVVNRAAVAAAGHRPTTPTPTPS